MYLLHHQLGLPAYAGAVFSIIPEFFLDEGGINLKYLRKERGIKGFANLSRRHHKVVSYFVADQNGAVAVVDDAPGRINGLAVHRLVCSVGLVTAVYDLNLEKPQQKHQQRHTEAYEQSCVLADVHLPLLFW